MEHERIQYDKDGWEEYANLHTDTVPANAVVGIFYSKRTIHTRSATLHRSHDSEGSPSIQSVCV